MSVRSTADLVAFLQSAGSTVSMHEAADRLTELDAIRPPCPTCGGRGETEALVGPGDDATRGPWIATACPDCVDGKVSIERLVAVFNAVHGDAVEQWQPSSGIDAFTYLRSVR